MNLSTPAPEASFIYLVKYKDKFKTKTGDEDMNCQEAEESFEAYAKGEIYDLDIYNQAWQHVYDCRKRECLAKLFWSEREERMTCERVRAILSEEIRVDLAEQDVAVWHVNGSCPDYPNCPAMAEYAVHQLLPSFFDE